MLPEREHCTGCGSCAAVCPHNCIQMLQDAEGFRYPQIDAENCVGCRQCEAVCPVLPPAAKIDDPAAFAVRNRDDKIRESSSSGGVFTALAQWVLDEGGAVCAAKYDENFNVCHDFAFSSGELAAFRGAKYAQSRAEHCFGRIHELLKEGKTVLFVGTPCQTAGLQAYLGKPQQNLLLADMICHGVPSPGVWQQYLLERRKTDAGGAQLRHIDLRSKKTGWSRYTYSVHMQYENGASYCAPQGQDWFMRGFVQNLYLRPSCGNCKFKGNHRVSDLTLGDCWGIWDIAPEFDDNRGTSLLLLNSLKGQSIWQQVCGQFEILPLELGQAMAQNPSAVSSSLPHSQRSRFFAGKWGSVSKRIQRCLTKKQRNLFGR